MKIKDKNKALLLRKKGYSYSQIKKEINVSKSTLSNWLFNMPLSDDQIRALRDNNPIRIEKYRRTRERQRKERLEKVYEKVSSDINCLSRRELLISGLFLYWAEGTKSFSARGTVSLSNTDPGMIIFYLKWLSLLGVEKTKVRVKLHLYKDMDIERETDFWSKTLGISRKQFRRPYIKDSMFSGITYKNGFGHGTCTISLSNIHLYEYILMGIKYIKDDMRV